MDKPEAIGRNENDDGFSVGRPNALTPPTAGPRIDPPSIMPPTPTYILQLSTEELWEIIDHIPNPLDILTLSLVSKRFAEVYRDDSVWRRHLTLGGWNVDAIVRHSRTEYKDRQAKGIWVNLARAACARWHVLRPGYDQKPSTWMSRFQGWRLWKRVAWPDYIRKLDAVTSEIGQRTCAIYLEVLNTWINLIIGDRFG